MVGGPSSACPTPSRSQQTPGDILPNESSGADSAQQEVAELRQQLQAMKKRAITIMDQYRKSSEREKIALRQAQEALKLKETTVAEALQANARENCMLELMTDASEDMAGTLHFSLLFPRHYLYILS
jgi:Tfp pilus assembly protein PilN